MTGIFDDELEWDELREMFTGAEFGATVQSIPGRRAIPWDHTEDERYTQYVQFTHGDKPQTGWYLLMGYGMFEETDSPKGYYYNFSINLFFIGTDAYYQPGFRMKGLERSTNDWNI